jgi:dipeptidyl aminopeptidase/acylaminoacyl peptidase
MSLLSADGVLPDPQRPPAIQTENVPAVPAELLERWRLYQNTRSAGFRGWSPDGKGVLVRTRFGETAQLHRVSEPGGRREQITFFEEPADGQFLKRAIDGTVLLSLSSGGDEQYQIYSLNRRTGQALMLTDGKSRNLLQAVHPDGNRIIIASNQRNGKDTDLYIADPRKPNTLKRILETKDEYWSVEDWSSDDFTLLINRYVSINESYPALLDIVSGEKRMIPIPDGKTAAFGAMKFSPDGRLAYVASDANGEFQQLAVIELESLRFQWLTADIPWNVTDIQISPETDGKYMVAFSINENGASGLYLLFVGRNEKTGAMMFYRALQKVNLPLGIVDSLKFSPDGKHLGFTFSRPDAPSDVYSISLDFYEGPKKEGDTAEGPAITRWTYSEVGGVNPELFISPERIEFTSFDGRKIPAYSFKPRNASKTQKVPVIINIHGGPESQYRPYFSSLDQFFLNEMGYAVIRPNVRGSEGYGKTYLLLDNAEKREDSVKDIGALLDWIAQQPDLDKDRVAVMGGSYGGYMVLGSLVNFSDRLKAGVDIVGIASFTTFLKNTSEYRRDLRRAEYGDERDPKMQAVFEKINPTSNAEKIKSALMVAHGRNDPRVPFSEAVQIVEKVKKNGQAVWSVYADNEGHGFSKKANKDYLYAAMTLFLEQQFK